MAVLPRIGPLPGGEAMLVKMEKRLWPVERNCSRAGVWLIFGPIIGT